MARARKSKSATKPKARSKAKTKARTRAKTAKPKSVRSSRAAQKPIELYYWSTPNGYKISIMLEECRLPYRVIPVNISKGDQFKPEFLAISPNNRIPAIVDPDGPGGKPISIFESGAILQYLGRKTGKFYPAAERARVEVDQWLMWQVGGIGPMAGQAHHFRLYAPEKIPYAIERYTNECHRLYRVMNKQLEGREFLTGKYSIADIACIGWISRWERHGIDLNEFPNVKRWLEMLLARPAVHRAMHINVKDIDKVDMKSPEVRSVLFNQR